MLHMLSRPSAPGAGLSLRGQGDFLSLLPVLNWTAMHTAQGMDDPKDVVRPGPSAPSQALQVPVYKSPWPRVPVLARVHPALG
jgi:SUN domain-containing protein 1/2